MKFWFSKFICINVYYWGRTKCTTPKYATLSCWLFWIKVIRNSFVPLKAGNKHSIKGILPILGRIGDILIARDREFKAEKAVQTNFVISLLICYPMQKPLCLVKSSRIIVSLSKGYKKNACFGDFFEPHIFGVPICIKLNLFFSCWFNLCQFNYETSQRKKPYS